MNKDCPDAKPDKMPDDADDELREAFADADSMAHSGYTREQIWDATGIDYGPTPNGDSPTAADTIRRARAHERTLLNPRSATARFAHRRDAAHKQALEDAEIENRKSTIENPAEAGEAPLSADELAALRALGGEINPAQIAADADYMTREMLAGLREGAEEGDELENRDYKRSSDGRFASTGAGQNNPRHKRASSGNPRAKRNKTNIPANLPPNATDGELERRLRKDMDNAAAHKGNQTTKRGDETYATTQKSMDHVREHVDEYLKTHPEKRGGFDTQKMNARAAKIMAQADFDADGKDAIAYGDGLKVVKSKNPKTGETEITTIYPEGKYRKQNK